MVVLVAAYPGAVGCVYVHVYCRDFLLSMCLPFKAMNTKWWDEILMHKHTKTQCEQNMAGNLLVCPEIKGQFTPEMMVNSNCTTHILPVISHLKFLLSALSVFWFHFQKPTKHVFVFFCLDFFFWGGGFFFKTPLKITQKVITIRWMCAG